MKRRKKVLFVNIVLFFVLIVITVYLFNRFSYKNVISVTGVSTAGDISSTKQVIHKNHTFINSDNKDIIGYLIIDKIKLKQPLYSLKSDYNHVDYNVEIHKSSDFPNVIGGNFILEGHSGNNYNSFFRNLYLLKKRDEVVIEYNGYLYTYVVDNIYEIKKSGTATIKRDYSKSTITLITCTKNKLDKQTIYIGYLEKKECLY